MISRRRFVQLGSMSGAVLGVSSFARGGVEESALPPSIAALKSMKDQAKPITLRNGVTRQEKARRLMEANRIDALLLMEGTSLELLHRHSLVGWRTAVRDGAARQGRGFLCVSGVRRRTSTRANRERSRR